ncbi:hypothetical protein MBLNU459_g1785t1 [Dothideomycetes sp. NU459]
MAGFITNYIQNTATNMLATGITVAGNMAGNAVGGVGTLIENGGRSVGDGVAGGIKSVGDYINSYGDRAMGATAASGSVTAVKKTAVKPSSPTVKKGLPATKKALPASSAPKALPASPAPKALPTTSVRKALPSAGGKPKALPAPPSSGNQTAKRAISAASKPKLAGSTVPGASSLSAGVKPTVAKPAVSKSPALNGIPKTALPPSLPKKDVGLPNGKAKISAESRPKPAAAKTVVKKY